MTTTTHPDPDPDDDVIAVAERALIGELITSPTAIREAAAIVTSDDFADGALGQVYDLIAGLVTAGTEVTPITVAAAVDVRRRAQTAGDIRWPTLADLGNLIGVGYGATAHAQVIRDASIARQTIQIARRIAADAMSRQDPATLPTRAIQAFTELRDGATPSGFRMDTLGEVLNVPTAYDWLIPNFLESADRLVLTGAEGGGKTYWLRQIAVLAAAGIHPLTFDAIRPVRVCYVDVENSRRQWARNAGAMAWKAAAYGGVDPRQTMRLECTGRLNLRSAGDLAKVHRVVDDHDPEILVIGPLYKLVPGGINNDDDAAPLITALDSIRDRGVAMLMEAHAGHGKGADNARDLRPRGSAALLGWPEFGLGLAPDSEDETLAHIVRWRGDRDQRDLPTSLRRGGPWPWMDANMSQDRWMHVSERLRQVTAGRAA